MTLVKVQNITEHNYDVDEKKRLATILASSLFGIVSTFFLLFMIHSIRLKRASSRQTRVTGHWLMRIYSIISAFIILVIVSLEIVELHFDTNKDINLCGTLKIIRNLGFGASLSFIGFVLWLRQRNFYLQKTTRHITNKFMRGLSQWSVYIMTTAAAGLAIAVVTTRTYSATDLGCKPDPGEIKHLPGITALVITVLFNVIYVSLSTFPLIKHRMTSKVMSSTQLDKYLQVIKRCFVCTLIPVLWSCISFTMETVVLKDTYTILIQLVYDVDIFVLWVSIVASYQNWPAVFAVWRTIEDDRQKRVTMVHQQHKSKFSINPYSSG